MQEVKGKSKHHRADLHFANVVKLQFNCDIRETSRLCEENITWFNLIHKTNILHILLHPSSSVVV